jgi:hypothetical protein
LAEQWADLVHRSLKLVVADERLAPAVHSSVACLSAFLYRLNAEGLDRSALLQQARAGSARDIESNGPNRVQAYRRIFELCGVEA